MTEKRSITSLIKSLEGSMQEIRSTMRDVQSGGALTELTQALLSVDKSAKHCRAALSNLDNPMEPFE